ncbi:UNVERIFIED_CONTAM: hypothetical protein FKN15_001727 [Acipenser sinensis]
MLQSLASNSCVRLIQSNTSTWYFVFLVLGYVLYLIFGAVVFSSVELPYEDLLRQDLRNVKRQFLQENECLSEERLEEFLGKALEASSYGVSVLNNATENWNWDFTSALFFASTVLSTTGGDRERMTSNHETYLLMASTQNDMEDWVKTIRRVIWAPFGGDRTILPCDKGGFVV